MSQALKDTVREYMDISDSDFESFLTIFKEVKIPKRTLVIKEGGIARKAYFILNGSMRFMYNAEGVEITGSIFTENMFITAHDSFLSQQTSRYSVESIEETIALEFVYSELAVKIAEIPSIQYLISRVLERRLTLAHKTIARLITLTPEQRYKRVLEENPEWIQRVPHHIIASYIGITPVSLSRIRKRL